MSEESIINNVKSDKTEPEDVHEKTIIVERLVTTKGEPKILPRYLSGPRGSCHDRCKQGTQHAVEAKPWSNNKAHKRVTTRERKTKVPEGTVTSLAGTEKSRGGSRPSLTSKVGKSNFPVDIKEVTSSLTSAKTVTSGKNLPPSEVKNVSREHTNCELGQAPSGSSSLRVPECSNPPTKRELIKSKSPFGSSSRMKTESRSQETRTTSIEGKKKSMPPSIPLSSKQNVKPSSLSAKTAKNLRGMSDLKNHNNAKEVKPQQASNDDIPEKVLGIIEHTPNLSV